jgi:large subunit ribosomal protein L25
VHFQNQEDSPGLKRGGTLNIALHEIALSVPADEIPEDIIHDLTGLDIGDSIRIGDLKLPGSAQPVLDASVVVATITGASAQMAEEAAAEAAEGGAA